MLTRLPTHLLSEDLSTTIDYIDVISVAFWDSKFLFLLDAGRVSRICPEILSFCHRSNLV